METSRLIQSISSSVVQITNNHTYHMYVQKLTYSSIIQNLGDKKLGNTSSNYEDAKYTLANTNNELRSINTSFYHNI